MATIALEQCKFAYNEAGMAPEYMDVTLSSGYAGVAGDLCIRTNNALAVVGADPTWVSFLATGAAAAVIPGLVDITQSSRGIMQVMKIRATDVFQMNLYHSTAASAVLSDADIDDALRYGVINATVSSVTAWLIDKEETSSTRVTIVKRLDAAADLYPRCHVKFLDATATFGV